MEVDRWRKMILIIGAVGLLSCLVITADDEAKSRCSASFQSPTVTRTVPTQQDGPGELRIQQRLG